MMRQDAVRQLLETRNKQIGQISDYMNQMGLTAALVGGFAVSCYSDMADLVSNGPTEGDDYDYGQPWYYNRTNWLMIMASMSALTVAASVHCVVFAMYLRMWAQRLALLGPYGSLNRSIKALRVQQNHVKISFLIMLLSFSGLMMSSFWILDVGHAYTGYKLGLSILFCSCTCITFISLWFARFPFRIPESHVKRLGMSARLAKLVRTAGSDRQAWSKKSGENYHDLMGGSPIGGSQAVPGGSGGSGGMKTDADRGIGALAELYEHPDFEHDHSRDTRAGKQKVNPDTDIQLQLRRDLASIPTAHMGSLEKRSRRSGVWQKRFFVLEGHEFAYYKDEAAYQTKPQAPCKGTVFSIQNYEVLIGQVISLFLPNILSDSHGHARIRTGSTP